MMPVVNQVFSRFDADDSGFISLEELFNGLAQVMDGSVDAKAEFYFDLYDMDGGGTIDANEVRYVSGGTSCCVCNRSIILVFRL